jgi:hypothetical protein
MQSKAAPHRYADAAEFSSIEKDAALFRARTEASRLLQVIAGLQSAHASDTASATLKHERDESEKVEGASRTAALMLELAARDARINSLSAEVSFLQGTVSDLRSSLDEHAVASSIEAATIRRLKRDMMLARSAATAVKHAVPAGVARAPRELSCGVRQMAPSFGSPFEVQTSLPASSAWGDRRGSSDSGICDSGTRHTSASLSGGMHRPLLDHNDAACVQHPGDSTAQPRQTLTVPKLGSGHADATGIFRVAGGSTVQVPATRLTQTQPPSHHGSTTESESRSHLRQPPDAVTLAVQRSFSAAVTP